jgi:DNA mismatch repair protein MutS2
VLASCRGESTRRHGLRAAATHEAARAQLRELDEATALLERGTPPLASDLRDVEEHLARLERQGALAAAALADLRSVLQAARELRLLLAKERERAPALFAACPIDPGLDRLEAQLRDALDPDGTLSDRASPELKALRTEIANLRARIVGRLDQLIERYADVLSDRYYTVRDGRYVLPVRRDAHEDVPGIVHGTSQSGSSVFVEPRPVVAHGNRLKLAESELEREEQRVLGVLSDLAREHLPALLGAVEALERADLRQAAARFGRQVSGCVPELCEEPEVFLHAARHPLLVLDGANVVANDIAVQAGRGLVISGPNASGKTVVLKTLGLCALMVRHGLPIAAARGSRLPLFQPVLTDFGDEQSTIENLSTFSAHVTNVAAILRDAGPRSLVLLDELATGTDPLEGAALACAIVDALCRAGAVLAVTTHYEALKALSLHDARLRSASVGFDVERMEPTFVLTLDLPGASNALLVARRFGIPESVIEHAARVLPEQARDFERLVAELGARAHALDAQRADLAREHELLAAVRAEEQSRLLALRREGDAAVAREASRLIEEVRAARAELQRAREAVKAEGATKAELADSQKRIDAVAARVALGGDLAPRAPAPQAPELRPLPEDELRPGLHVRVPRLRADAVILEGPVKGRVRVAAGALKLWVECEDLSAADGRSRRRP